MASRNVSFFLRLSIYKKYYLFTHRPEVGEKYRLFSSLSLAASDLPSRDPLPFNGLGEELIHTYIYTNILYCIAPPWGLFRHTYMN